MAWIKAMGGGAKPPTVLEDFTYFNWANSANIKEGTPLCGTNVSYTIKNSGTLTLNIYHQQTPGGNYTYNGYIYLNGAEIYHRTVVGLGVWYKTMQLNVAQGDVIRFTAGDAGNQIFSVSGVIM